jgi:hypothetical protein
MSENFKVGDQIERWKRQSSWGGGWNPCEVIEVVKANSIPSKDARAKLNGTTRDHESYVVRCVNPNGTFWPLVKNLRRKP